MPPFLFIREEDSHRPLLNKTIENYFEICIFLNEQGKKKPVSIVICNKRCRFKMFYIVKVIFHFRVQEFLSIVSGYKWINGW